MRKVAVSPQMGANRMQWSYKRQESVNKNKKTVKSIKMRKHLQTHLQTGNNLS